ncbi:hypothetical protein ECZU23_00440 [Escherichia coli]|nr:hypothetical protein ECZU23_00440 [Escherichia coli]
MQLNRIKENIYHWCFLLSMYIIWHKNAENDPVTTYTEFSTLIALPPQTFMSENKGKHISN